jgi:hypothetical protein
MQQRVDYRHVRHVEPYSGLCVTKEQNSRVITKLTKSLHYEQVTASETRQSVCWSSSSIFE